MKKIALFPLFLLSLALKGVETVVIPLWEGLEPPVE